jgi:hypothetical protein
MTKFVFETVEDIPIEETTVWDYLALVVSLFAVIYLLVIVVCLIGNRKYKPLAVKHVPNLVVINVAAAVHVCAVFLSNDHIESIRVIKKINCPLWGYYLQYAVGLNTWFVAILYRCASYNLYFLSKNPHWNKCIRNINAVRIGLVVLLSVPIWTICTLVVLYDGSTYSYEIGTCHGPKGWMMAVLAWTVVGLMLLVIFALVTKANVDNKFFNESKPLKTAAYASIVVIVLGGAVSFSGFVNFSVGRSLFTVSIAIFHLVTSTKLTMSLLVNAVKGNYQLVQTVDNELNPLKDDRSKWDQVALEYAKLSNTHRRLSRDCANDFIFFCSKQEKIPSDVAALTGITSTGVNPLALVTIVFALSALKNTIKNCRKNPVNPSVNTNRTSVFMRLENLNETVMKLVGIPETIRHSVMDNKDKAIKDPEDIKPNVFDLLERWIHLVLCQSFIPPFIEYMRKNGKSHTEDTERLCLLNVLAKDKLVSGDIEYFRTRAFGPISGIGSPSGKQNIDNNDDDSDSDSDLELNGNRDTFDMQTRLFIPHGMEEVELEEYRSQDHSVPTLLDTI